MGISSRLRSLARALLHRDRFENGMTDELRFHLDAYAADLERAGVPPAEAARRARLEFGNVDTVKQDARQARGLRLFDELRQDLRYAVRLMRSTPGFTAAAVLSLGLGIGANTAIFSLIDAVLLRSLPVPEPDRLYFLAHGRGDPNTNANYPLFERYRDAPVFSGVTAYRGATVKVAAGESAELTQAQFVSGNYHAVVGAPLAIGRGFTAEPDRVPGGSPIAVISDGYWRTRFGRAPDVLGKTLTINGRVVSIVGVTAPAFTGFAPGAPVHITLPLSMRALEEPGLLDVHDTFMSLPIVARLAPGVAEEQALAVVDPIFQQYMSEPLNRWARKDSPDVFAIARLVPAGKGGGGLRRQYETPLYVLMWMVGLVLLIAAANVANLLLARSAARAKEVAIRLCVGGGRSRLIRQFLTESLVLAMAGGILAVAVAAWGTGIIVAIFGSGAQPIVLDVSPNARVLGFTAAVSLATGLAFGLAPAFTSTRLDLTPALKEGGAAGRSGRRVLGKTLVAAQVGLCVVVVAVAALLARSVHNLKSQRAGFERANVVLFSVDTFLTPFSKDQLIAMHGDLIERVKAVPGVLSVALSTSSPINTAGNARFLELPGQPMSLAARAAWDNRVSADYHQTLGIRLLKGRTFTPQDSVGSPKVAIANETAARYLFGTADPIGQAFAWYQRTNDPVQIVGVVEDTHQANLREAPARMIYTPLSQGDAIPGHAIVSVKLVPGQEFTAAAIGDVVRGVNPNLVVLQVRTMEQQIDRSLVRERALTTLSTGFAGLALVLACIGLYGVMSYNVTRRAREIGIRMALGARRDTVLAAVLRETALVSAAGVVIGIGAALIATREVATFLFGLSPRDPATLAGVGAALIGTALVAGYFPARRAARIDPARAIRCE